MLLTSLLIDFVVFPVDEIQKKQKNEREKKIEQISRLSRLTEMFLKAGTFFFRMCMYVWCALVQDYFIFWAGARLMNYLWVLFVFSKHDFRKSTQNVRRSDIQK